MLTHSAMPLDLIARHRLDRLTHERGGEKEVQFHLTSATACLPVSHEGQLRLMRWGCRRGESGVSPVGSWTKQATVESGFWSQCGAEPVDIPAALGLDGGMWYALRQGCAG